MSLRAAGLRYPVPLQPEPGLPGAILPEPGGLPGPRAGRLGGDAAFHGPKRLSAAGRHRHGSDGECPVVRRGVRKQQQRQRERRAHIALHGGNSAHYNVNVASGAGLNGNASKGGSGINLFADPAAVFAEFRPLILGLDTSAGGAGVLRGLSTWNVDATASKDFRIAEKVGATLILQANNVFNHFQPCNPSLNIDSPQTWGVISSQANTPRQMQFGLRIHF